MATEHQLPAKPEGGGRKAEGYFTPKADKTQQCAVLLPPRVIPIVFLPGTMGTNLRIRAGNGRQERLDQDDNIAWRPDTLGAGNIWGNSRASAAERQLRLDPLTTEVDRYEPNRPRQETTGKASESSDQRHSNVVLPETFVSPLLMDDPPTANPRRTAAQKARERGWGEMFFKSYGSLLCELEGRLQNAFSRPGVPHPLWHRVLGVDPVFWAADPERRLEKFTAEELKQIARGCWFPVHAIGYNWLRDIKESAEEVGKRIDALIESYKKDGYRCEKVIVVTHSMGGLVGRGLVHPDIGGRQDKVLGVVHGVQPAIGAPAAYKRIRAGFEDPGMLSDPKHSIVSKVLGNYGDEVTAVLANATGGLQLLPGRRYGNGWLRVQHKGKILDAWPKQGNPYKEIYKVRGRWFSLIREQWINPAGLAPQQGGGTIERTHDYLDDAEVFHATIENAYHPCTYAHYGVDPQRTTFGSVTWVLSSDRPDMEGWRDWSIVRDSRQGGLEIDAPQQTSRNGQKRTPVKADIAPPETPGDQTVPVQSADDQRRNPNVKGVFRQMGYEHQASYADTNAVSCTLYSIMRIAQQMNWSC